jgi:hypothetical protein
MNTTWLTLSKNKRIEILNLVTDRTGLPANAIEKDWWVTLALNAIFSLPYSQYIIFKGGTSWITFINGTYFEPINQFNYKHTISINEVCK